MWISRYKTLKTIAYPAIVVRRILLKRKFNYQISVYNNLQNSLVGNPTIKVDEFQGQFCVDVRSDIFKRILIYGCYEPSSVKYCKEYVNKTKDVIDIGANVGFYTVLFTKIINNDRKVLSIEPVENALEKLYKNIRLNQVKDKVIVFEGAASDVSGTTKINTVEGKEEYSSMGKLVHSAVSNEVSSKQNIRTTCVDEIVTKYQLVPGLIKVDVEGFEFRVFKGCKETLKKHKPVILSELSDALLKENGSSVKEIINFWETMNYKVIDAACPEIPVHPKRTTEILCVPRT
jgi:FkbM family methyltransferase